MAIGAPLWMRVDADIRRHEKTLLLQRHLGCSRDEAVGVLVSFWGYVMRYRRDGCVADVDPEHYREETGRDLTRDCNALRNAGWLDDTEVHDWLDYQGKVLEIEELTDKRREQTKQRVRRYRARRRKADERAAGKRVDVTALRNALPPQKGVTEAVTPGNADTNVTDVTVRDVTERDETDETEGKVGDVGKGLAHPPASSASDAADPSSKAVVRRDNAWVRAQIRDFSDTSWRHGRARKEAMVVFDYYCWRHKVKVKTLWSDMRRDRTAYMCETYGLVRTLLAVEGHLTHPDFNQDNGRKYQTYDNLFRAQSNKGPENVEKCSDHAIKHGHFTRVGEALQKLMDERGWQPTEADIELFEIIQGGTDRA